MIHKNNSSFAPYSAPTFMCQLRGQRKKEVSDWVAFFIRLTEISN